MDPDACLKEMLELTAEITAIADLDPISSDQEATLAANGARLAELVESLDSWIAKGGFLPSRWR
jgi:hypothetical protein